MSKSIRNLADLPTSAPMRPRTGIHKFRAGARERAQSATYTPRVSFRDQEYLFDVVAIMPALRQHAAEVASR